MQTEVEGFFEALRGEYEEADAESKERGAGIAQRWAFSRLSYKDRRKQRDALHKDVFWSVAGVD